MQILIANANWFSTCKKMNEFLVSNRNKWLDVDTTHLFDNQYNTERFRIYDAHVAAVKDDLRGECAFQTWEGIKPSICVMDDSTLLSRNDGYYSDDRTFKGFNLSYRIGNTHYVFTNHRKTFFKFLYRDGVFYESNGIGYEKLTSLKSLVRADMIKPLSKYFEQNYIEGVK